MKARLLLAAVAVLAAGSARAQTHAMPPDPYDTHQPAEQPIQASLPAPNDYPAAEVQAVPGARARAAAARAQLDNSRSSLHTIIDELKEDFEYSADLSAAMRDEKAAYDHYIAARDHALKQLANNRDYKTLKNLCKDLNDRLYSLKGNPITNKAEIVATAQLKLAYATQMSQMES